MLGPRSAVLPALLLVLLIAVPALAAPPLMSYQGFLTDDQGTAFDGTANLEFALFDSLAGGVALWSETHAGVPVAAGLFHVALGSTSPFDASLFTSDSRWLETRVEGTPLTPRRPMLSAPFALRAAVADVALSGGSGDDWENTGADVYRPSGNVGIGTSAPTEPIHVVDPLFARVLLDRSGGSSVKLDASLTSASVGTNGAHPFRLTTNNAVRMHIDSDGEVGVGTTSPGARLDVRGDGTQDPLHVYDSSSTLALTVDADAQVGIGVSVPAHTLDVSASATDAVHAVQASTTGSQAAVHAQTASASAGAAGVKGFATNASGQAAGVFGSCSGTGGFGVRGENTAGGYAGGFAGDVIVLGELVAQQGADVVTIDGTSVSGTGAFAMGSGADMTLDSGSALTLTSGQDLLLDAAVDLSASAGSDLSLSAAGLMTLSSASNDVRCSGRLGIGLAGSAAFYLQLAQNSAAKPTSNTWTIFSDRRLKQNIQPIQGALEKVLALQGVTYEWIDPASQGGMDGVYMGLIAQDVEPVFPEWVSVDARGYRTLTVSGFEGLMAEALRELQAESIRERAALESRCRELEARVLGLESRLESRLFGSE